ncbi:TPA: hypothetical protein L8P82_001936 [Klebsiella pneumoniae]|nr:hypothetical protein [Klebsiella pneumoniae]RUL43150.1 hypothetical protein ELP96_16580 [Klebsiella pneumoniae subsp. pneumoniae]MBS2868048.1 hypothetical protein [Klebsiella pneumoniae]MCB3369845.1 hypothetical protein [Klebsiella pneumoniae]QIV43940.1 hypothetical protein HC704_08180 [Klebsiella pneumoniae]
MSGIKLYFSEVNLYPTPKIGFSAISTSKEAQAENRPELMSVCSPPVNLFKIDKKYSFVSPYIKITKDTTPRIRNVLTRDFFSIHIYIKKYNATDTIKLRDIDIYILINKHEIIIKDNNLLFVLIFLNSINAVIPNIKTRLP